MLRQADVRKLMQQRSTPDGSNLLLRALRAIMKHAVDVGMRADDPTAGVPKIKVKRDGYHTWTEADIEQFERVHPVGSRARLAFALLLYTGQRRSDVIRLGRQHIRDGLISLRQQKTGTEVTIPVHTDLAAILARTVGNGLAIISSESRPGHPIGPEQFGHWFRRMCNQAGLPHCSAHGLRKAAARRLAEAGATAHEIASITGHKTLAEVQRYSEAADRVRLARSAMDKLGTSRLSNSEVLTIKEQKL
jgi:integrase